MPAPITLTIYDENNEVKRTLTRVIIPWKMLKKAVGLRNVLAKDEKDIAEADMDSIAGYVIELFGQGLTVEELDNGCDIGEMMSVIRAVIGRASGLVNPTLPPA